MTNYVVSKPDLFIYSDQWFHINSEGELRYSAGSRKEQHLIDQEFEIKEVFKDIEVLDQVSIGLSIGYIIFHSLYY